MEETQSFRLIGTSEIEKIPIQHVDGQDFVYWEDIEQVFPAIKHVKNGDVTVTMARDSGGIRTLPYRIKHYPGVVLNVVLLAVEHVHVDFPMETSPASGQVGATADAPTVNCFADAPPTYAPAETPTNAPTANPPAHPPTDHPVEDHTVEILQITSPPMEKPFSNVSVSGLSTTSLSLSRASASVKVAPKTELFQKIVKKAQAFQVEQRFISSLAPDIQERIRVSSNAYNMSVEALNDGRVEESERLKTAFKGHFQELKAVVARNTDPATHTVELLLTILGNQEEMKQMQIDARMALEAKQEEMKQLQIDARKALEAKQAELEAKQDEIKDLQIQALGQLAVLQTRIKAVLTQTYELH
ncbi:hypothetical protein BGZ72_002660, partial [Mortierella alpina]